MPPLRLLLLWLLPPLFIVCPCFCTSIACLSMFFFVCSYGALRYVFVAPPPLLLAVGIGVLASLLCVLFSLWVCECENRRVCVCVRAFVRLFGGERASRQICAAIETRCVWGLLVGEAEGRDTGGRDGELVWAHGRQGMVFGKGGEG